MSNKSRFYESVDDKSLKNQQETEFMQQRVIVN